MKKTFLFLALITAPAMSHAEMPETSNLCLNKGIAIGKLGGLKAGEYEYIKGDWAASFYAVTPEQQLTKGDKTFTVTGIKVKWHSPYITSDYYLCINTAEKGDFCSYIDIDKKKPLLERC